MRGKQEKIYKSNTDNFKMEISEPENQKYIKEVMDRFETNLPETINKQILLAGSMERKHRTPKEFEKGEHRGIWKDNKFFFNDDFVPKQSNPDNLTIGELKKILKDKYEISLDGISYRNNVADFSPISVANISSKEVFMKAIGMSSPKYEKLKTINKIKQYSKVFTDKRREKNFLLADEIAAQKQIKIPGLRDGYTKEELTEWREKNKFSWDENLDGYLLVPAVIHLNLGHTGAVSISKNAYRVLKARHKQMKKNPESFCWNEDDAPTSISKLGKAKKSKIKKRKGDKNMPKRKSLNLGNNIERPHGKEIGEIDEDVKKEFKGIDKNDEIGEKFLEDKNKLENKREEIESNDDIPGKTKQKMLDALDLAMNKIEKQYEKDVAEKQKESEEKIKEYCEIIAEYEERLREKLDSLEELNKQVPSEELEDAIAFVENDILTCNLMKNQFTEELSLKMQQAERQQRNIRARHLSGNN